jgi:hypothetical protein
MKGALFKGFSKSIIYVFLLWWLQDSCKDSRSFTFKPNVWFLDGNLRWSALRNFKQDSGKFSKYVWRNLKLGAIQYISLIHQRVIACVLVSHDQSSNRLFQIFRLLTHQRISKEVKKINSRKIMHKNNVQRNVKRP